MTLRLGPHIRANNSSHDIDNLLFGVDWPCLTWLDNGSEWGRLNTYHTNHPRTVITGRIPAVEDYYKQHIGKWDTDSHPVVVGTAAANMIAAMNAPKYVYWRGDELNNEHEWSAAFHLAFLKRLNELGYKGCGPMYAEGNPHVRRFDGFSDWPYHKDLLAYMDAHSADTLLAVNAYRKGDTTYVDSNGVTQATADDDAAHLLRIEDAISYLDEWGYNNVKIVFGETGLEYPIQGAVDDAQMVGHAKDINRLFVALGPRLIGGTWYDFSTLAGGYSGYPPAFLYPFIDWAKAELAGIPTQPPPTPPVEPSGAFLVSVTSDSGLRVRSGPSTAYPIETILLKNMRVQVRGKVGDWYQLAGRNSYIHSAYTAIVI